MAQDALALIDALELEKPIVCGWNGGACVALQMAVWAPERATAWVFMDAWLRNAKEASRRGMLRLQQSWRWEGPLREQPTEDDLARFEQLPGYLAYLQRQHHDPSEQLIGGRSSETHGRGGPWSPSTAPKICGGSRLQRSSQLGTEMCISRWMRRSRCIPTCRMPNWWLFQAWTGVVRLAITRNILSQVVVSSVFG